VEEFALLSKNHGKRSKKYGTLRGRLKRFFTENGTVRYGHGRRINSEPLLYLHSLEKKSIFSFFHIPILGYTFELLFTNGVLSDREAVIFFEFSIVELTILRWQFFDLGLILLILSPKHEI